MKYRKGMQSGAIRHDKRQPGLCTITCIMSIGLALSCRGASAENWFMKDGTEPDGAKPIRVYGLVQPTYQCDLSDKVTGLTGTDAAYNDKYSTYASIPPGYTSTSSFYLFRVRLGVRGLVEENINYEVVGEYGANALTTKSQDEYNVELAEGSVTLNHVPGMRVRLGIFKVPGPEEAMRTAIDYVNFTNVTFRLINYQPMEPSATGTSLYGIPAEAKTGVRAFRDTGVEIFDAFRQGDQEWSYAFMVGNGSSLNGIDDNRDKAVYGRVQWSWLFKQTPGYPDPARQDLTALAWYQSGDQTFAGADYTAVRQGVGISYVKQPYHLTAEYMWGDGMIVLPSTFRDGVGLVFPGSENEGRGWYVDAGAFVTPHVAVEARYDELELEPQVSAMKTTLKTLTLGAQYYFSAKNRVALNYEIRDYDLAAVPASSDLANSSARLNSSISDRIAIQYTLKF